MTYAQHLDVGEDQPKFRFQDIKREEIPKALPIYLLWICQVHLAILMAAHIVFEHVAKPTCGGGFG